MRLEICLKRRERNDALQNRVRLNDVISELKARVFASRVRARAAFCSFFLGDGQCSFSTNFDEYSDEHFTLLVSLYLCN